MYKVVLIDDEDIIVEGLRKVIKWEEFGCVVAGTASDAGAGAELIRNVKPDICFTDIRMPEHDGLSMIAGLKSEFPDMQVIVLTGYSDFSYAQEAIRLGVLRYILKPSKMNEINEALSAALEKLSSMKKTDNSDDGVYEAPSSGRFTVNQALDYIEELYAEKLTLASVADHCYVSQWHLSKLLNGILGKSFYDILNDVRIAKARELLRDPSLSITDVSEAVGYSGAAHFSRIFKQITGLSPAKYRNSL